MSSALELDKIDINHQLDTEQQPESPNCATLRFPAKARIILAHEESPACEHSKTLFSQAGWAAKLQRCASLADLQAALNSGEWDLVITYAHSQTFAPAVIAKTVQSLDKSKQPALIYIAEQHCPTNATEIIRCGFSDYLSSDEPERLVFSASREIFAKQNERIAATSEAVIAEAEAKSQILMDSTSDAVAYASDGMLIHVNQPLCNMLGFSSPEELELQPLIDLVTSEHLEQVKGIIKMMDAHQQDQIEPASIVLLTASGEPITLTLSVASASHDGEACSQIIFSDSLSANPNTNNSTGSQPLGDTPSIQQAAAPQATGGATVSPIVRQIENLQGRGLAGFLSISAIGAVRKALGFADYRELGPKINDKLQSTLPESAMVGEYRSDNWLLAFNDEDNSASAKELGASLCAAVNELIRELTGLQDESFCSLGLAKFGIAEINACDALDKAFIQCAEVLQGNGGFKVFAPRIDNAEGSAALKTALELDRLTVKYQPVIGLQNQSSKLYRAYVYLRNDAGQEIPANSLIENLGIEKDNVSLDYWLIENAIESIKAIVDENPNISVTLPLTASALVAEDFMPWLENTIDRSGLAATHLAFEIDSATLGDYEQPAIQLSGKLQSKGCATSLANVTLDDMNILSTLKPNFVKLAAELTANLNAEEEKNSKETLKTLISDVGSLDILCVATAVSTAAELAQLWQTGIPFVQGDYLQAPLSAMNYEFSDIA